MLPNYLYQPGDSIHRPVARHPVVGHQLVYNADYYIGFNAGYIEGLETGRRLLQQEIQRSQYPLSLTHQGGIHFPARVIVPVATMPATASPLPPCSHVIAPSLMSMNQESKTPVSVWRPFDNDRCTVSAVSHPQTSQVSTSVTASGYPTESSRSLSTQTVVKTSTNAGKSLISHPNISEAISHPSTSQTVVANAAREMVTPEAYRQSVSLFSSSSDDEIDVGGEGELCFICGEMEKNERSLFIHEVAEHDMHTP